MTEANRKLVLKLADEAINGDRNSDYGEPVDNFNRIAALWSAQFDRVFTVEEVAIAMILTKTARLAETPGKCDSWVDISGYSATGYDAYTDSEQEYLG